MLDCQLVRSRRKGLEEANLVLKGVICGRVEGDGFDDGYGFGGSLQKPACRESITSQPCTNTLPL
jgi:hypothetical protein